MSTGLKSVGHDAGGESHSMTVQSHQKRNRMQLSCTSCRHAKLRCDRGHPCSQCIKRNRSALCAYILAPARQKPSKNMQTRLHHLESLVIEMMNDQQSKASVSPLTTAPVHNSERSGTLMDQDVTISESLIHSEYLQPQLMSAAPVGTTSSGQVVLGTSEITYIGATHWAAILDDIEVVKSYFSDTQDEYPGANYESQVAAMVLGDAKAVNRADLLAALPERSVVDRLVSRYFNSNDPAMIIIHKPTFQNEYQEFWVDPASKSVTWLGLLFAIMNLATFYSLRPGDDSLESHGTINGFVPNYQALCSQSLVLGDYLKPGPYTIEALLLCFESEFSRPGDGAAKCWVLHGLAVRLALKMGYHRDASHYGNISAFHGEMRRRVWHLMVQVDLILSFQVGLPSMVQAVQSDTGPPHNLFDDDFSYTSSEMPPSRPESDPTPMSYMICKSRICHVFGMITDQANSIVAPSYSEVLNLDSRLHDAYALIPPFLLARALNQSITDSPNLIMQRFNIVLLFHKSRCVLHRKYLLREDADSRYTRSRSSCIDSALELLHYQAVINDAVQSGGPLGKDRWFLTTIAAHDFLLGAMIIYLALRHGLDTTACVTQVGNVAELKTMAKDSMREQLQNSSKIWYDAPREARDAKKASMVLETMLRNVIPADLSIGQNFRATAESQSSSYGETDLPNNSDDKQVFEEQNQSVFAPPGHLQDLESMIDMPDTLDWETWDNEINARDGQTLDHSWASDLNFDNFCLPGE